MIWQHVEDFLHRYQNQREAHDEQLYRLCKGWPGHADLLPVMGKVALLSSGYEPSICRYVRTNEQMSHLEAIANLLSRYHQKTDSIIGALQTVACSPLLGDANALKEVVRLQGQLVALLEIASLPGTSLRGFASKYAHFHAPGVPIYSAHSASFVKNWCKSEGMKKQVSLRPAGGDAKYAQFCEYFFIIERAAKEAHLTLTVRQLDQLLASLSESARTPSSEPRRQVVPEIVDRGRGPELKGTRITVYRIMDFLREGSMPDRIARELRLTDAQVDVALKYIETNRQEVESVYEAILKRVNRGNPAWVEQGRAKRLADLKQRILAQRANGAAHDYPGRP